MSIFEVGEEDPFSDILEPDIVEEGSNEFVAYDGDSERTETTQSELMT